MLLGFVGTQSFVLFSHNIIKWWMGYIAASPSLASHDKNWEKKDLHIESIFAKKQHIVLEFVLAFYPLSIPVGFDYTFIM